jgi:hypothetical protein
MHVANVFSKRWWLATLISGASIASHASVVVVVGSGSEVTGLSQSQVADIFLGRVKGFPSGGTALTAIPDKGPAKDEFLEKVLGKTEQQARAIWSRLTFTGGGVAPKEVGSSAEMKRLLSQNPSVIGVINKEELDAQVKVVFQP